MNNYGAFNFEDEVLQARLLEKKPEGNEEKERKTEVSDLNPEKKDTPLLNVVSAPAGLPNRPELDSRAREIKNTQRLGLDNLGLTPYRRDESTIFTDPGYLRGNREAYAEALGLVAINIREIEDADNKATALEDAKEALEQATKTGRCLKRVKDHPFYYGALFPLTGLLTLLALIFYFATKSSPGPEDVGGTTPEALSNLQLGQVNIWDYVNGQYLRGIVSGFLLSQLFGHIIFDRYDHYFNRVPTRQREDKMQTQIQYMERRLENLERVANYTPVSGPTDAKTSATVSPASDTGAMRITTHGHGTPLATEAAQTRLRQLSVRSDGLVSKQGSINQSSSSSSYSSSSSSPSIFSSSSSNSSSSSSASSTSSFSSSSSL